MKTYEFERRVNRLTQAAGWKALWMDNADPAMPMQCTHDILEHAVDTEGWATGEMQAYGAILLVRGQSGYFAKQGREPYQFLASELAYILRRVKNGREVIYDPGHTVALKDRWVEDQIWRTVHHAFEEFERDYAADYPGPWPMQLFVLKRFLVGWMRKGYRAATNLYCKRYGLDCHKLGALFEAIEDQFKRLNTGEIGRKLAFHINFRAASFDVSYT